MDENRGWEKNPGFRSKAAATASSRQKRESLRKKSTVAGTSAAGLTLRQGPK